MEEDVSWASGRLKLVSVFLLSNGWAHSNG